jgi:hypothetical protein
MLATWFNFETIYIYILLMENVSYIVDVKVFLIKFIFEKKNSIFYLKKIPIFQEK